MCLRSLRLCAVLRLGVDPARRGYLFERKNSHSYSGIDLLRQLYSQHKNFEGNATGHHAASSRRGAMLTGVCDYMICAEHTRGFVLVRAIVCARTRMFVHLLQYFRNDGWFRRHFAPAINLVRNVLQMSRHKSE